MSNVTGNGFRISDEEASQMMTALGERLDLGELTLSAAPVVKQAFVKRAELWDLAGKFPATAGWVLFTDGLANFLKLSENDKNREIMELEICDDGTDRGSCTLRAVMCAEDYYSVTLVNAAGGDAVSEVMECMKKGKDGASGEAYVYACTDVSTLLKNSFLGVSDGADSAWYRVWYRCKRLAGIEKEEDNESKDAIKTEACGRWDPWMQQFMGFVKASGDAV